MMSPVSSCRSDQPDKLEYTFKAHFPGVFTAGPLEPHPPDLFCLLRVRQEKTNLCDQVVKAFIGYDLGAASIKSVELRMIFREIQSPAHGNLKIPPLEAVRLAEAGDASEADINPASGIHPHHLLRGQGTVRPTVAVCFNSDAARSQSFNDQRPVAVALADEGYIDGLFHVVRPVNFRIRAFRKVDG